MPNKRTPSAVTLRCRALVKIERCKAKIALLNAAEAQRRDKYDLKMEVLALEVNEAQAELETIIVDDPEPIPQLEPGQ